MTMKMKTRMAVPMRKDSETEKEEPSILWVGGGTQLIGMPFIYLQILQQLCQMQFHVLQCNIFQCAECKAFDIEAV